jgi:hypothetical protein
MSACFPEVDLLVNSNGVTIFCPYLMTPRFVPFDLKGRCSTCKSDNVEIDYVLQPNGITIYCSRMKQEKFVKFDVPALLNDRSFMRIRARGKTYNVPLNRLELQEFVDEEDKKILDEFILPAPPQPPTIIEEIKHKLEANEEGEIVPDFKEVSVVVEEKETNM